MSHLLADYASEHETAKDLNQNVRTLRKWRALGEGPAWIKVGRLVFYSHGAVAHWLKSIEQKPVRQRRAA